MPSLPLRIETAGRKRGEAVALPTSEGVSPSVPTRRVAPCRQAAAGGVLLIYRSMWLLRGIGQRLLGVLDRLQRAFHRSPPAFRRAAAMLVDALIVIEW